jgi:hypothetical protein
MFHWRGKVAVRENWKVQHGQPKLKSGGMPPRRVANQGDISARPARLFNFSLPLDWRDIRDEDNDQPSSKSTKIPASATAIDPKCFSGNLREKFDFII